MIIFRGIFTNNASDNFVINDSLEIVPNFFI